MVAGIGIARGLSEVARGEVGVYVVQRDGSHRVEVPGPETVGFRLVDGKLEVDLETGRAAFVHGRSGSMEWIVLTYDRGVDAGWSPFLGSLFQCVAEKDEIAADMESMFSSSLALLEEVSIVGEMLPKLPTGDREIDVVRMGLEALVVAASLEGAVFVRFDDQCDLAEVLVQVRADGGEVEFPGDRFFSGGIAWRAIHGGEEALLESVPPGGHLGDPGSPESLAQREVIAVPVRYGDSQKPVTLGALLLLDKRPNAYASAETFGSQDTKLASSVAAMLGSVLGARKVAELGNEMRNAHTLHQQIRPDGSPQFPGFDLAGDSVSPGAVGGDYYDFLRMPDGRLMCVVADVSGHNLASCLVMVSARAALRLLVSTLADPGAVFDTLARTLFSDLSRTELFITAVGVSLEPETREMQVVNAGHNPTMIYRARTGAIEEVFATETVLGFLPEPEHEVAHRQLESGDVVLLYTDGVTEAADGSGAFFEEERLRQTLTRAADGTAAEILAAIYREVEAFADADAEGDDISVVVIKVK